MRILRAGERDVNAAEHIDDVLERREIDAHVALDVQIEAGLDFLDHQICSAVTEAVGQPVVLPFILAFENGNAHASLKADELRSAVLEVEAEDHYSVGSGRIREIVCTLVGTEQEDVEDVLFFPDLTGGQLGGSTLLKTGDIDDIPFLLVRLLALRGAYWRKGSVRGCHI